jgi:hypothetical protein
VEGETGSEERGAGSEKQEYKAGREKRGAGSGEQEAEEFLVIGCQFLVTQNPKLKTLLSRKHSTTETGRGPVKERRESRLAGKPGSKQGWWSFSSRFPLLASCYVVGLDSRFMLLACCYIVKTSMKRNFFEYGSSDILLPVLSVIPNTRWFSGSAR